MSFAQWEIDISRREKPNFRIETYVNYKVLIRFEQVLHHCYAYVSKQQFFVVLYLIIPLLPKRLNDVVSERLLGGRVISTAAEKSLEKPFLNLYVTQYRI